MVKQLTLFFKNTFWGCKLSIFLYIVVTLLHATVFAQTSNIGRFYSAYNKSHDDTAEVNLALKISEEYRHVNLDSSLHFTTEALALSEKLNYYSGICRSKYFSGLLKTDIGSYELAIELFTTAQKLAQEHKIENISKEIFNGMGIANAYLGNWSKSMSCFQKSLQLAQESGDSESIAFAFNNLGIVQENQGNTDAALNYYNQSLQICEKSGSKKGATIALNNIGNIYAGMKNYRKAYDCYEKSRVLAIEMGNKKELSNAINNLAIISTNEKNFDKAIELYTASKNIDIEMGDKQGLARSLGNIASVYIEKRDYKKAMEYGEKGLEIADSIKSLEDVRLICNYLAYACEESGNFKDAVMYYKRISSVKDSIQEAAKQKEIMRMESIYQNEKKQQEILLQKEEIKRQRTQKYGMLVGMALLVALSLVILKSYRDKKKANILLTKQKSVIEENNMMLNQQNEEIITQRDEIEAQRDLVTSQKNEIEHIHKEITQSISYAKKIQSSILPDLSSICESFHSHFVLFKPRDIVSGDFYWGARFEDNVYLTVADCTGHGVPGAFMSMLGVSFLREIVLKEYITEPELILKKLRKEIINVLQQRGLPGEQKDGMDMALCVLNSRTLELKFAGANNPLYFLRDGVLTEIKPDKMPIGIYENMSPFNVINMQLAKGDQLYMMSDGFEDQFGGPKGKKYLSKNLKKFIESISGDSMKDQCEKLNIEIENWKITGLSQQEQTDDITILGIRI